MGRSLLAVALLASCAAATGCRSQGQPVADQAPEIHVLAAGSAPRRALAYRPSGGDRQLDLTIELPAPAPGEGTKLGLVLDWSDDGTADDGRTRRDYAVTAGKTIAVPASAGEQEASIIRMIGQSYRGIAGHALATPSHVRFAQTAGKPVSPSVTWMLTAAAVPLPAEPVGVGARWRAVQRGVIDRSAYVLDVTYELVGLEADSARLRVSGEQVEAAGEGDARTSTVDGPAMAMRIAGEVEIGFGDVLPRSGRWSVNVDLPEMPGMDVPPGSRDIDIGIVFAIER